MEYTAIQDKFVFIYGIEPNKQTYRLKKPEASQVDCRHLRDGEVGGGGVMVWASSIITHSMKYNARTVSI